MIKTLPKIEHLQIQNSKPLIICDADEVIFDFMSTFELYLKNNNLSFTWKSYALSGNICNHKNIPIKDISIKPLLKDFFKEHTLSMSLVSGVKETLRNLSQIFNIIILSNIPFEYYENRKKALYINKIEYPFVANLGLKGKTVKKIINNFDKICWFIDDSPNQIKSVKKECPSIKTMHFVSNTKLSKLIGNSCFSDHREKKWYDIEKTIIQDFYENN